MAKDGHYVPVETRIWLGKWNGKECLFGICKDLSAEQEAQQRFERLFRRNPSLMAVSSLPDRKFMDVNDAFLTTLGYARAEIIGKTAEELHLFSSAEQYAATSEQLMTRSRVASVEMQVRAKDGTLRDSVFSGELIDSQGRQYFLTVMSDITDRKRIEREMAKLAVIQRELMHLATDFVNVPLERQDAAINESLATMGQLIDADRAYLFAYDLGAGVMRNTHEWCGAGITPEIENLQAVPTSMVPEWVETHIQGNDLSIPSVAALSADSTLRALLEPQGIRSLVTLPLTQGGRCLGFVGFDAVRSERIWTDEELAMLHVLAELYAHFEARRSMERSTLVLQQQLIEARDSAQAAAHSKSLFLANMSHEIRTPLNAVLGYAQIMEIECRACPTGSRLTAITRSGEHLLSLLNDLLELVRGDTGVPTLTPVSFDFFQMLEDVRILFAERPEAQGLTLEVSHPGDVPQWLYADAGKLRQILVNLTSNATKYTVQGGVRLSATVLPGDGQADLSLAVEVEDTGCGIQAEDLDRIFNLFYVKEAPKNIKGTGLGLPLSQRLAHAIGGDITVRSSLGLGSCFRVTFRARAAAAAGATPPPRPARIWRLALDQRAYRLLVVDDDDANLAMIGSMLELVGFTVETVASAAQALQRLSQADAGIDLVMMDKNMPMMDGYAATVQIRALPGGRTLPVLVVTASGFSNERERALAAGADGCLFKPVHREPLLAEIGRLLGVRYIHEPAVPAAAPSADTDPTALARLPAQQRHLLDQALRRGDAPQLRNLVQAIACEQPGLAAELRVLVEAYAYDRLRQLLDAVKGTAT
jgi:PAS domain S-box-containing protein